MSGLPPLHLDFPISTMPASQSRAARGAVARVNQDSCTWKRAFSDTLLLLEGRFQGKILAAAKRVESMRIQRGRCVPSTFAAALREATVLARERASLHFEPSVSLATTAAHSIMTGERFADTEPHNSPACTGAGCSKTGSDTGSEFRGRVSQQQLCRALQCADKYPSPTLCQLSPQLFGWHAPQDRLMLS